MEIALGVHKIEGVWGGNVYLLVDGSDMALVDTGLLRTPGKVARYMRKLGLDVTALRYILLTHGHPDHTGGVRALHRATGAEVVAHSGDVRTDGEGRSWARYISQPLALSWSVPLFQKVPVHRIAEEGPVLPLLDGVKLLHTPGHTAGSVAFYLEKRGILFTGDTLLANGRSFFRPFPFPGSDDDLYFNSLEKLAELDFDVACVGHGTPIIGGADKALRSLMDSYPRSALRWGLTSRLARLLRLQRY